MSKKLALAIGLWGAFCYWVGWNMHGHAFIPVPCCIHTEGAPRR